jgi:hypothetical protein
MQGCTLEDWTAGCVAQGVGGSSRPGSVIEHFDSLCPCPPPLARGYPLHRVRSHASARLRPVCALLRKGFPPASSTMYIPTNASPRKRVPALRICPWANRSDDIAHQAASLNGLHFTPPNRLMSGWCSEKCLACNIPTWLSPDPRYWKQSLRSLVAEKGCDFPRTIGLGGFCCTAVTCGASGALLLCRC